MKAKANEQVIKQAYVSPSIEIIEMENEGVIAASGEDYNPHPLTKSSYSTPTRSYNSASGNDLEDLINDILTVEN